VNQTHGKQTEQTTTETTNPLKGATNGTNITTQYLKQLSKPDFIQK